MARYKVLSKKEEKLFESCPILSPVQRYRILTKLQEFPGVQKSFDFHEKEYYETLSLKSQSAVRKAEKFLFEINFELLEPNSLVQVALADYLMKRKVKAKFLTGFLSKQEKKNIIDENNQIKDKTLYKFLLIQALSKEIKSAKICLKYSENYLSIESYLIPKPEWEKDRVEILKETNLYSLLKNKSNILKNLERSIEASFNKTNSERT